MPKSNILEKLAEKVWGNYSTDVGKALIHMGAFGWFLSAAAQITMIATNKDIDKKEKKFLIPQETADGIINVGLYYTICQCIKNIGDNLAENCRFITETTFNAVNSINTKDKTDISAYVKDFSEKFQKLNIIKSGAKQNLTNFYDGCIECLKNPNLYKNLNKEDTILLQSAFDKFNTPELREKEIELLENAKRNFNRYKNGIGVITSVGASILACNLITPIARNITANYYQKKLMKHSAQAQNEIKSPHQNKCMTNQNFIGIPTTFKDFKIWH